MIDLRQHHSPILQFLERAVEEFIRAHPDVVIAHAAVYCCPWSGWLSLCLDSTIHRHQNCPDFEFFEVALYECDAWSEEYENNPVFELRTMEGRLVCIDVAVEGDEALNEQFFEFLQELLHDPRCATALAPLNAGTLQVGVQLLDSRWNKAWAHHRAGH